MFWKENMCFVEKVTSNPYQIFIVMRIKLEIQTIWRFWCILIWSLRLNFFLQTEHSCSATWVWLTKCFIYLVLLLKCSIFWQIGQWLRSAMSNNFFTSENAIIIFGAVCLAFLCLYSSNSLTQTSGQWGHPCNWPKTNGK